MRIGSTCPTRVWKRTSTSSCGPAGPSSRCCAPSSSRPTAGVPTPATGTCPRRRGCRTATGSPRLLRPSRSAPPGPLRTCLPPVGPWPTARSHLAAVRVLSVAHDAHPEAFSESESMLVDAARALPHREMSYAVRYWRHAADAGGSERWGEEQFDRRRLSVSATAFGMVRVDGNLDPETGQTLLSALRTVVDADVRAGGPGEPRTPGQRRADALGEICRQWLDRSDRPAVAGERPHVTLTVGLDVLAEGLRGPHERWGEGSRRCELEATGPITPRPRGA